MILKSDQRPRTRWERSAWNAGKHNVAGADEVGRGAWAGPIVAAAVILPRDQTQRSRLTRSLRASEVPVRDSKLLTAEQRERAVEVLLDQGIEFNVAVLSPHEIDRIGLGRANRQVLCDAVHGMIPAPDHVLVDAFVLPNLVCSHDAIVRGDSISVAIALASIVAKTHRDSIMVELCARFPEYGFSVHKGYGTERHRSALLTHGVTPHHRRSFRPVAEVLAGASLER